MDIIIKGRNLEVTDTLKDYIERKVGKLERYLSEIREARIDLSVENSRNIDERNVVQLTVYVNGSILRAEESTSDMHASIDAVMDKMSRQIRRFKGKHRKSNLRPQPEFIPEEEPEVEELIRVKTFVTRPMSVDEAIDQMELLSHDFFAFYSAEHDGFAVVYRRRTSGYGLLIPQLG